MKKEKREGKGKEEIHESRGKDKAKYIFRQNGRSKW